MSLVRRFYCVLAACIGVCLPAASGTAPLFSGGAPGGTPLCWQTLEAPIQCDPVVAGAYQLTLTLQNSTAFTGEHAFIIAPSGPVTITPNYFDLSSVAPGGTATLTLTISGGNVGDTVCFQVTLHDETLVECCSVDLCVVLPPCNPEFIRGDCNRDGLTNIADAVFVLVFLFGGGAMLSCEDACDCNDDGTLNIADAVYKLSALFGGGPPPPLPNPDCGPDPTPDSLTCMSFPPC